MKLLEKISLAKVGIFLFRMAVLALAIYALVDACSPEPQETNSENEAIKVENKIIEISKQEDIRKIDSLTSQIQLLRNELAKSKVDVVKAKKAVKSIIENGEVADYYNNRYGFNDAKTTEAGTIIGDSTAYHNITELIDLDYCKKDFKTLSGLLSETEKREIRFKSLWEKTEIQKDNNYKLYQNDSTALAKLRNETNREVKFRMSMHFEYGNTIYFSTPEYKANILIFDKNNNSYSAGIGKNEILDSNNPMYYIGYGRQLFQIKGKKK